MTPRSHTNARVAYEIIPFDPNVNHARRRHPPGDGGTHPQERRAGHRHLAHGQAADRPRGAEAHPGAISSPGWNSATGAQEYMEDRIDEAINRRSLRARGSSRSRATSGAAARSATTVPGGPRSRRRSCAASRSKQAFGRTYEATMAQSPPRREKEQQVPEDGSGQRQVDVDVHPDAPYPGVRGTGQADVRGAPGRDPRPHASRRRCRGLDRRRAGHAASR